MVVGAVVEARRPPLGFATMTGITIFHNPN
jgi:hypothetical protein